MSYTFQKHRTLDSLLDELIIQKDNIENTFEILNYLKSKIHEIKLIEQITVPELKKELLQPLDKEKILKEIDILEETIDRLMCHYNMKDSL